MRDIKKKFFGTDGIRGIANKYPMTPEITLKLGRAIAEYLFSKYKKPKVLIGKDTRLSGYMFENVLTAGLVSMGCDVYLVGPMPTPAVGYLTKSTKCSAGIVISASHNPADYNGIKIFGSDGYKLNDKDELIIENFLQQEIFDHRDFYGNNIGKAYRLDDARGRYVEFAKSFFGNESLKGLKIVVDCANGAAYSVAPLILNELGADVVAINNKPNGRNINLSCGALYPKKLQTKVKETKADFGFALDGDADRIVVCDEKSNIVNGDALLALFAKDLKDRGMLSKNTVVVNVMTNLAFDSLMHSFGISVVRTNVGDKYVIEKILENKYSFGGEQSGHIIFRNYSTTGDGILAALELSRILKNSGEKLSKLTNIFKPFPQKLINIEVRKKKDFNKMKNLQKLLKLYNEELGEKGRILIRYSGTENIARILVEADSESRADNIAKVLANEIQKEVGA